MPSECYPSGAYPDGYSPWDDPAEWTRLQADMLADLGTDSPPYTVEEMADMACAAGYEPECPF